MPDQNFGALLSAKTQRRNFVIQYRGVTRSDPPDRLRILKVNRLLKE